MITKNTVFILGAGASAPYGYPTGAELRKNICEDFVSDYYYYLCVKNGRQHVNDKSNPKYLPNEQLKAKEFADVFYYSSTPSIDLFLNRVKRFEDIGRIAITLEILESEAKSTFRERIENKEKASQDWYSHLFHKMTGKLINGNEYKKFNEDKKVSFITFNYDRSLEHFLYESLCGSFHGVPKEDIKQQLVDTTKFVHVYGQIAPLDWQETDNGMYVPYQKSKEYLGKNYSSNPDLIEKLSKNIKLIHEREEYSSELDEAKETIKKADRIFFLGFGYDKKNMEILGLPGILKSGQKIYGTAFGTTEREREDIFSRFGKNVGGRNVSFQNNRKTLWDAKYGGIIFNLQMENMDCLALLREYLQN